MAKTIAAKTEGPPAQPVRKATSSKPRTRAPMKQVGDILSQFPRIVQKSAEASQRTQNALAVAAQEQPPAQLDEQQLTLPFWPPEFRSLPNEFARSALFNARNRSQKREDYKEKEIYVIGKGKITYRGEELRQDDETVWLQLIQIARSQPMGETVRFTAYAFCKAVGWPIAGASYKRLRDCLTRMQATALKVTSERLAGGGVSLSMIPEFRWQDERTETPLTHYEVKLAQPLVALYGDQRFTRVEWEQRLALPDGIATWLHGYFASHRAPFPIKLEQIKAGAGLTTKQMKHLRTSVETALDELKRVKFLKSWKITGDLVSVERQNLPDDA